MGGAAVILEAILGVHERGAAAPRFAPMGVECEADTAEGMEIVLRPFYTSRTGRALIENGSGVLNFTDDPLTFAKSALTDEPLPCDGEALTAVCMAWKIAVKDRREEDAARRWQLRCEVLARHAVRPFAPFCRARYAVLEAAILATRLAVEGGPQAYAAHIAELEALVRRTGGEREMAAMRLIRFHAG